MCLVINNSNQFTSWTGNSKSWNWQGEEFCLQKGSNFGEFIPFSVIRMINIRKRVSMRERVASYLIVCFGLQICRDPNSMKWFWMRKIFPICSMMKQLLLSPVGIWHTRPPIAVDFFPAFFGFCACFLVWWKAELLQIVWLIWYTGFR